MQVATTVPVREKLYFAYSRHLKMKEDESSHEVRRLQNVRRDAKEVLRIVVHTSMTIRLNRDRRTRVVW
jgi:hypothetical protein